MRSPEFLIIGGQKCGSSACAKNLSMHPEIGVAKWEWYGQMMPEFHYFDLHWQEGKDWYAEKFVGMTEALVGEKTPEYFHRTECHGRMACIVPNAKLVVLLRNPIDRAYSAFNYARLHHGGEEWFGETYPDLTEADAFDKLIGYPHECIDWGHYHKNLESLYQFYGADSIHVEIMERVQSDMESAYNRIYGFLGLPAIEDPGYRSDYHSMPYDEPMSEYARETLWAVYRDSNNKLRDLINDEVPEWA